MTQEQIESLNEIRSLARQLSKKTAKFLQEPAPAEPQHVWKVGDYALCPDGKIHKVRQVEGYRLDFYDYGSQSASVCTPVPEPERPELPEGFSFIGNEICYNKSGFIRPLCVWIEFCQFSDYADKLLALSEWRKLVGRDM
jgi:hypothetical protein